jgi:methylglutamate dehydrogenase subunit C
MRIDGKGLIDRTKPVRFRFDGQGLRGLQGRHAGLGAAGQWRAAGRAVVQVSPPARHLTAGSEEPNALVEVLEGGQQTPNVRATMQEMFEGLEAQSQNRWPSLRFDLMAVNDWPAPFLSAGFYYKTFMWPRAFWEKLYEPLIRRAAGLGSLSGKHDEGRLRKGLRLLRPAGDRLGAAGLMAALTAARAGADVILAEEEPCPAGGFWPRRDDRRDAGADWVAQVLAELQALPNVRMMPRTTVTGAYDHGTYGALERVGLHKPPGAPDLPRECFWRIVARSALLASGRAGAAGRLPQQRPAGHHDGLGGADLSQPLWRGAPGKR